MGLGASQVRLLQLTGRQHTIGRQLTHLALEKTDLNRDMRKVSKDYQKALSSKKLEWSNNAGVSHVDLSYSLLMSQNASNPTSPLLVINSEGKVVLDSNYKKYAEMLNEAGGVWEGDVRLKILSSLTGVPEADIKAADDASAAADSAATARNNALSDYDTVMASEPRTATQYLTTSELAKKLGKTSNGDCVDLSILYSQKDSGNYSIKNANDMKDLIDTIKNSLSKYFVDDKDVLNIEDKTKFINACDSIYTVYESAINSTSENADKDRANLGLSGDYGDWKIPVCEVFNAIMGAYQGSCKSNSSGEKTYVCRDTSSSTWQSWYNDVKTKKAAYESAEAAYSDAVSASSQLMTADKEAQIKFYDLLFKAIEDNGWVYDLGVEDTDYLNQQFQNNNYMVMTISKNDCYDPDSMFESNKTEFYYDTYLASNYNKIYSVNNSDLANEALAEYEYKKSLITEKETRIDNRMNDLRTEEASIKQMLESINTVMNDNIEKTMGLWA